MEKSNQERATQHTKKWLKVKGDKVLICPNRHQVTYLDNNKKYISKFYSVLSQKYIQSDIVMTALYTKLGEQPLQKNETLKAGNCQQFAADEKRALTEKEI